MAAFLAPSAPATTTTGLREVADISGGLIRLPDRAPHAREMLFFISSRTGMMVKRPAVGAEGFVLNHYDRARRRPLPDDGRRPPAVGLRRGAALRRVLRQPRSVRVRLDRRLPRGVQGAPRLRPAAAAARARARRRAGHRRDPPRLGTHADGAPRRTLPRAHAGLGDAARHALPHPGLRHPARHHLEQRRHRSARRRGRAVEDAARVAVGRLHRAPLRPARHLVGNVDVAPLAVVQGLAARREGGGRPALPPGHQPVDRPRLALHRRRRGVPGMAFLRGRRLQRQEPLVDRDARRRAVPAARQLPAAAGPAGQRRRVLPAERRRLGAVRAGKGRELHRGDEPAPRAGRRAGDSRRGVQPRLRRRRGAGRAGEGRRRRTRHRPEPVSRHHPARCRTDAGGDAPRARGVREAGRARVRDTAHAGAGARIPGHARRSCRRRRGRRPPVPRRRAIRRVRRARRRPGGSAAIPPDTRHGCVRRCGRHRVRAPPDGRGRRLLRRQHVEHAPRDRRDVPRARRRRRAVESDRRVGRSRLPSVARRGQRARRWLSTSPPMRPR